MRPLVVIPVLAAALAATALATPAGSGSRSDDPSDSAELREARAQAERRETERRSPEAKGERRRSRTRYADASDERALAIAKDQFPRLMTDPLWPGLDIQRGERVRRYLGDYSAIVERANGERSLVESTNPIRARTESGDKAPIDLSFESAGGDDLAPRNGLVRTRFSTRASDGVRFERSRVTVAPVAGRGGTRSERAGDKLFFANTDVDTDYLVAPVPEGFEALLQLRSARSPARNALRFDLPSGAKLELDDREGARVVRDEDVLITIDPPHAFDADGESVPAVYRAAGDRLQIDVRHEDGDFRYPIMVDPLVSETFRFYQTDKRLHRWRTGASDWNKWEVFQIGDAPDPRNTFGYGLYVKSVPNVVDGPGWGEWNWKAYGNSSIQRADIFRTNFAHNATGACLQRYIRRSDGSVEGSSSTICGQDVAPGGPGDIVTMCADPLPNNGGCKYEGASRGNSLVVRTSLAASAYRTTSAIARFAGASMHLMDYEPPQWQPFSLRQQGAGASGGWVKEGSGTVTLEGTDHGLGVKELDLWIPTIAAGGYSQLQRVHPCAGDRFDRCPSTDDGITPYEAQGYPRPPVTWAQTFTYDVNGQPGNPNANAEPMPEGINQIDSAIYDLLHNSQPWNPAAIVKVDRSPPDISATGSVVDATVVRDVPYVLDLDVRDGFGTGASARSGVQSITVSVDGTIVRTVTPDCTNVPDNCKPDPFQVTLDGSDMAEGDHEVVVAATDRVGHSTSKTVPLTVKHAATASVGPGEVNLLNGTFTTTATDASFPSFSSSLALTRTYSSRNPDTSVDPMFGRGWTSSLPVEEAAADYVRIAERHNGKRAELLLADGLRRNFTATGGGSYKSPLGYNDLKLTKADGKFRLDDSDGNVVTFTRPVGVTIWVPTQVDQPGATGANTTSLSYQVVNGVARPTRMLAPVPSGVSCSGALVPGCRALSFVYAASTTANGAQLGDFKDLVKEVQLTAFDPATGQMRTTAVARYLYDQAGYLRAAWDPRISPSLTTTYGYDGSGHLTSLTPPGQETWTLSYATTANDPTNTGRFSSVSRPALPGTATTKVVYGVPLTGSGAPYQMGSSNVAAWGQAAGPVSATAIFPPNHVPSSPPSSYSAADIHYLDNQGRRINLAEPGGRISTSEYEPNDNVVRELTPVNRERALASGSPAQRAAELETRRIFAADGTEMIDEVGPLHTVELASGETVQARRHVRVTYDEGRTGGAQHLPTTTTVSAQIAGRPDADARTTKQTYNWTLGKPVTETKDPGGLNLTETTVYDSTTGLVTETRQPSEPGGGGAGTKKTIYWAAGANAADAACGGKPEWANLACKTTPAAQPGGSLPPIPVTQHTYNWLGQVATQSETSGTTIRTHTFTFDAAGRELSEAIASGTGAPQPTVFTAYHPTLGLPTTTSTSEGTITRGYDTLGRPVSYADASGNASTTTYDLLSRPVTTTDGKGSQTRTYDSLSGDLTAMSISGVGSLSASYDADGKLMREVYPNGLSAQTTYDESGSPTRLEYTKSSNCGTSCTWYTDRATSSIHGQWLTETSTLGDKDYAYDAVGRLKEVRDTPAGMGCTVRAYQYDVNSNRTARIRNEPGIGGVCHPTSTGTRSEYHYDAADRLDSAGYTYDAFGRTLRVPGRDAGAAGAGVADMVQTYFADDRIASIDQDLVKSSYTLDPSRRVRTENVAGVQQINRTNHYSDDSDSPTWSSEDSLNVHWTRNITGIDGDLIAIQDSVTGMQFQLTNLHGDLIATASANSSAPELLKTSHYDEFGVPATGNTPDRYGWLGSKRRATSHPSGAMLMGQRVYLPTLGRFVQTDPVAGGSANAYDYSNQDPLTMVDLLGLEPQPHDRHGHDSSPVAPFHCLAGNFNVRNRGDLDRCRHITRRKSAEQLARARRRARKLNAARDFIQRAISCALKLRKGRADC